MDITLNDLNAQQIPSRSQTLSRNQVQPSPVDVEDTVDGAEIYGHRDLIKVFLMMWNKTSRREKDDWILEECKALFKSDYECRYMDNFDDNIPGVHPKTILIPITEIFPYKLGKTMNYDVVEYLKQEQESSTTAVGRFPCPVIMCNGMYICRSRYPPVIKARRDVPRPETSNGSESPSLPSESRPLKIAKIMGDLNKGFFARKDVGFLNSTEVRHLFDLTNSTECDFKGDVANSEVLKNIYQSIEMRALPFPSRENFTMDSIEAIQETTKEYLLILLQKLVDGKDGILLQSFSGCHRAALFSSLLRVSLWADGFSHRGLKSNEITFLTISYDWYLFGYRMYENQSTIQDMMEFFFSVLPLVSSNEFSLLRMFEDQNKVNELYYEFPKHRVSRELRVKEVGKTLLENFHKAKQYMEAFTTPPE